MIKLKTPREMLELMKMEVAEMATMKAPVFVEDSPFVEDDKMFYNEHEIINYIKEKTIKENWEMARTVGPVRIDLEKLETYPSLIDCRTGKHKPIYKSYCKEVNEQLNKHPDLLEILKEPNIKINLYFFVNFDQKDVDNLKNGLNEIINANFDKAIIDILYYTAKKDDICLRKFYSEVWKNQEDSTEHFIIEVERQTHSEYNRCDVLRRLKNNPPL